MQCRRRVATSAQRTPLAHRLKAFCRATCSAERPGHCERRHHRLEGKLLAIWDMPIFTAVCGSLANMCAFSLLVGLLVTTICVSKKYHFHAAVKWPAQRAHWVLYPFEGTCGSLMHGHALLHDATTITGELIVMSVSAAS